LTPKSGAKRQTDRGQTGNGGRARDVARLPAVRTSERYAFKRCRYKWHLEFEEHLKPKTDAPPLRFGTLIHRSLASYYRPGIRRGRHPARTFEKLYEEDLVTGTPHGVKDEDDKWVDAGELGVAMLENYVKHYGRDDQYEVLVTEHPFKILVKHPITNQPWFWYVGVIDGIWRDRQTERIFIVDHKTAKAINVQYLTLDIQATAYWTWGLDYLYAEKYLPRDVKPQAMLYNHLRKAAPDPRPRDAKGFALNQDGSISKRQPAQYFVRTPIYRDWNDRENAREQIMAEYTEMEMVRKGELEVYRNQSQFTCPGCWAYDICEIAEMGGDSEEFKIMTTKSWDPYAEHEIYEGR
jgi:hypothetical protein